MRPASSGPRKPPTESAVAQIATPHARVAVVCVPAATMARLVGKMAAAPTPPRTRARISNVTRVSDECPAPDTRIARADPTARSAAPPTSGRLRPKRSPDTPKPNPRAATGSMKASVIHVGWAEDGARSCWISPLMSEGTDRAICARHTARTTAARVPGASVAWSTPLRSDQPSTAVAAVSNGGDPAGHGLLRLIIAMPCSRFGSGVVRSEGRNLLGYESGLAE